MIQPLDENTVAKLKFVNMDGTSFERDIQQDLMMSEESFEQDLLKQPSEYAWWTAVMLQAKEKYKEAETQLDYVKAVLGDQARATLGKATVAQVNDFVVQQQDYQDAVNTANWWGSRVDQLQYVVKAYEQRAQLLIQLGAQLRHSIENSKYV